MISAVLGELEGKKYLSAIWPVGHLSDDLVELVIDYCIAMPVHGIGIDILHVPRLAALIKRRGLSKLASRILSPVELGAFRALTCQPESGGGGTSVANERGLESIVRFLGVRWAVKEAAYKALHPLRPTWKELTYTSFDVKNGLKPALVYTTSLGPGATPARLHVSASHDGEYIVASVLAESG